MHVDNVTINADGSMTINISEFMNQTQAASFVGATPSVTVTAPGGGYVAIVLTLTPGAPIAEPAASGDPGGSASIDG